jgi:protoporphyrinogen oxidase
MSTDWLGPRLYRPELEEVLRGALSQQTADVHYVDHFRYPSRGGFEAYLRTFLGRARIECGKEVVEIDPKTKILRFDDGSERVADAVISSLPLPELVRRVRRAPTEVAEAAARLACTTCVTVNLGVAREDLTEHHWTYLYDRDQTATRLSFPHLFSPANVPAGSSSIQAEVYYSDKYRPLELAPKDLIEPVIADLRRCGLLREDDEIVHADARLIEYANVIFDLERAESVARVRSYLDEIGIATCGRYGEWGYQWTDESFESGETAAQSVLDGVRLAG